jgi:hypothetical protein
MAQVVKNADDTYTVTLTAVEQRVLKRYGDEQAPPRAKAASVAFLITSDLASLANDYRAQDGPKLRALYEAATPAVQAQVDALLGVT